MKLFLLLLCAAAVAPAVIRTSRSTDARTNALLEIMTQNDEPPADFVAKIEESLENFEPQILKLREMKPETRDVLEKVALVAVDFSLPMEERVKQIVPILDEADFPEEEKSTYRMIAIITIAMTEPMAKQIPVFGKELFTRSIKTIFNPQFLYGTRKTRHTLLYRMGRQLTYKMQFDADLIKESKKIEADKEMSEMKKKINFMDF